MSVAKLNAVKRRSGSTLIEMVLMISITGALMLLTIRVLHLATQVHESGIRHTTHLRLVSSLEDRLHSDIARATQATAIAHDRLHLVMADASQVQYQLTKPNLVERSTTVPDGDKSVVNQRWLFICDWEMSIKLDTKDSRSLVRVTLTPTTMLGSVRGVEVSEVTHGQ